MPSVPLVATFWSAQLTNFPPWPFNPFSELPVYEVAAETFVFDDRAVDYEAMAKEALALRLLRQAAAESLGLETLSLEGPPAPPGGGGGEQDPPQSVPPLFLTSTQLCLWPPVLTGSNALVLTITNAASELWDQFDLLTTSNLSAQVPGWNLTNWLWLGRTVPGQTNVTVLELWPEQGYFRLGTLRDDDGDGLPTAYEQLCSHTDPEVWSSPNTDGDGLPDAWELRNGTHPMQGDAGADADNDGLTNGQEYLGGSNPTSAAGFGVWVSAPRLYANVP